MENLVRAILTRVLTDDQGTLGRLSVLGWKCYTLELPWRGNASNLSCIPPGEYLVRWTRSPRLGKYTYEITNVQGRGGIRIHAGNRAGDVSAGFVSDSRGCPLLGKYLGSLKEQRAVMVSGPTVATFNRIMGQQDFILEVCDA